MPWSALYDEKCNNWGNTSEERKKENIHLWISYFKLDEINPIKANGYVFSV